MRARTKLAAAFLIIATLAAGGFVYARYYYEPGADAHFDTSVAQPAFSTTHPRVLFDHAHRNTHSIHGRYSPFAGLLRADGCRVSQSSSAITDAALQNTDILVIVNARTPKDATSPDAFAPAECDAIEKWVSAGGSLLLVADHHPCGPAAASLAARFNVVMVGGWTDDEANARQGSGDPGQLLFSRATGNLHDHPITGGVNVVETFTGQSLVPPAGAVVLMSLFDTAIDRIPTGSTSTTSGSTTTTTFQTDDRSAAGHCQGLALRHGTGRVVVLAEAAMLSAQQQEGHKFGMNAPGNDNKQFTLNTIRWLAGALGD